MFQPRVERQRVCRPWCRNERKRIEAKSARRVWAANGRPLINDDTDLRFRSATR
jgi:hypothetical protein